MEETVQSFLREVFGVSATTTGCAVVESRITSTLRLRVDGFLSRGASGLVLSASSRRGPVAIKLVHFGVVDAALDGEEWPAVTAREFEHEVLLHSLAATMLPGGVVPRIFESVVYRSPRGPAVFGAIFEQNVGSRSLFRRIVERNAVSDAVRDAARQLKRFHAAGFVHGDMHAGNVVFGDDGDDAGPHLVDLSRAVYFGVAGAADPACVDACVEFDLLVLLNGIEEAAEDGGTLADVFIGHYCGGRSGKTFGEHYARTDDELDEERRAYARIRLDHQ
jgi:hypothetical protein